MAKKNRTCEICAIKSICKFRSVIEDLPVGMMLGGPHPYNKEVSAVMGAHCEEFSIKAGAMLLTWLKGLEQKTIKVSRVIGFIEKLKEKYEK